MSPASTMPRPFSVTLMVILVWINALLTGIGAIALIVSADNATVLDQFNGDADAARTSGWVLVVVAILLALLAIGLSRGSRLLRMLITIVIVLRLAVDVYLILTTNADAAAIISIVFNFILLWLLWNTKANAFFNQS
jgi:hypothetical protein